MCRFCLYLGPPLRVSSLVTEPGHSLIHQSYRSQEREEPLNGDGFGLAWYAPEIGPEPAVFRSTTPAWNNRNLLDLARVVCSPCVLAHVRAATRYAAVTENNCHPFRYGRFAFMHNGDVGGFGSVRRPLLDSLSDESFGAIQGNTDSEHVFALLLDHVRGRSGAESADALAGAMRATIERVVELVRRYGGGAPSYLNMALTDGRRAVVTRFTSDLPEHSETLYLNRGRGYVCEGGVCRMIPADEGSSAVLVSSEPLSQESGWEVIPANHMVVIREDRSARVLPC